MKRSTKAALGCLKMVGEIGLTPREFLVCEGFDRLAARVAEIREIHGRTSVETVREKNGNGGHHARYFWRGP